MTPTQDKLALAHHLVQTDNPHRALEVLASLPAEAIDLERYWFVRAEALGELDRRDEAREAVEAGLARHPESVPLLTTLGDEHLHAADFVQAEKAYLAALQHAPLWIPALLGYAEVVASVGQHDKAEALIERAARLGPDRLDVWRVRYHVATLKGDDERASEIAREVAARAPDSPYTLALLGVDAARRGKMLDSEAMLSRAAKGDVRVVESLGAENLRWLRSLRHPLQWPMWPLYRLGVVNLSVGLLGGVVFLRMLGLEPLSRVLLWGTIAWFAYGGVLWLLFDRRG
ncbi:MAG: hypothetical protein AAF211_26440 [Myxococcota bacterium]